MIQQFPWLHWAILISMETYDTDQHQTPVNRHISGTFVIIFVPLKKFACASSVPGYINYLPINYCLSLCQHLWSAPFLHSLLHFLYFICLSLSLPASEMIWLIFLIHRLDLDNKFTCKDCCIFTLPNPIVKSYAPIPKGSSEMNHVPTTQPSYSLCDAISWCLNMGWPIIHIAVNIN